MTQVPLAPPPPTKDANQDRWLYLLWKRVSSAGQILWSYLDFTGSNLTDIETRNHNDLQSLQGGTGGEYYHLTSAEYTGTGTGVFVRKTTPTISGQTVDYIDFDTGAVVSHQAARMFWDTTHGTVHLDMGYDDVTQDVGLNQFYHVKNQTGSQINKLNAVMATGTLGASGLITGAPAIADGTVLPRYMMGVAAMDIADGADGYVVEFGSIRGVNTTGSLFGETWNDGDLLYISASTAGYLTNVEPTAPNLRIPTAIVVKAHSNGSIFVRPTRGLKLREIHDVSATTPNGNDVLVYDAGTGVWVPEPYQHNTLSDLQGGSDSGGFEETAFEVTAFQQGDVEYYHVSASGYTRSTMQGSITTTSSSIQLDDTSANCIVTSSGQTITLPAASTSYAGFVWNVTFYTDGELTISADGSDTIMTPDGADTSILVTVRGTTISLMCNSASTWVIV